MVIFPGGKYSKMIRNHFHEWQAIDWNNFEFAFDVISEHVLKLRFLPQATFLGKIAKTTKIERNSPFKD